MKKYTLKELGYKRPLSEINEDLNKEFPKFLKVISRKESDKLKHKNVMKNKVWSLLEELKECLM